MNSKVFHIIAMQLIFSYTVLSFNPDKTTNFSVLHGCLPIRTGRPATSSNSEKTGVLTVVADNISSKVVSCIGFFGSDKRSLLRNLGMILNPTMHLNFDLDVLLPP